MISLAQAESRLGKLFVFGTEKVIRHAIYDEVFATVARVTSDSAFDFVYKGTRHVNVDFNYDIYDAVCMVLTIHHSQWDST